MVIQFYYKYTWKNSEINYSRANTIKIREEVHLGFHYEMVFPSFIEEERVLEKSSIICH